MHSRAVSLSFGPYVLGAAHHWQCVLGRGGGGGGGGRLVRSRRTDESVVIVYSAVTGRDACTGRLVCMCAACTDSAVTWCDPAGRA